MSQQLSKAKMNKEFEKLRAELRSEIDNLKPGTNPAIKFAYELQLLTISRINIVLLESFE